MDLSQFDATFLHTVFLGNELKRWMIAGAILVLTWVAAKILHVVIMSRLEALSKRTPTKLDDLAVSVLGHTKNFFILGWGIYLAVGSLTVSPSIQLGAHRLAMLLTTIQIAIWGSRGITFWINEILSPSTAKDAASATTVGLLGLFARGALFVTIFLLALNNLGVDITALVAGLGVGGIAVALAVQNILGDLFASLTIVLDKPFAVGDIILVGEHQGTVEKIGMKTTRVRAPTGEQLVFPNSDLLQSRVRNFKRMQERRITFVLGVTYNTPEAKLRKIAPLIRAAVEAQKTTRFERTSFKAFNTSSLDFETVYLVSSPDGEIYAKNHEEINFQILRSFAEEGIEFAYPTQTLLVSQTPLARA
jgi:small-conductance mechanosensitive channel